MQAVSDFLTGSKTATGTPQPIIAPGQIRQAYRGVTVHCNTGTVYVGRANMTTDGYELPAGEEVTVPVEDPSKVYVVGSGTYSWVIA